MIHHLSRSRITPQWRFQFFLFQRVPAVFCLLVLIQVLGRDCWAVEHDRLKEIRERQAQIQQVVHDTIQSVVVVSDGIGFGSGVIVNSNGLILTAGHVMASDKKQYTVILPSGRELPAKPLGRNRDLDAGMVQLLEPGEYPFVELGDPETVELGDWCVCLGHPGGFKLGRSAPVRAGRVLELNNFDLVTDCALIGGDSGGPLFNLQGQLIGIHSSIGNSIAVNRHVNMVTFAKDWERLKSGESWGKLPDLNRPENSMQPLPPPSGKAALGISVEPDENRARVLRVKPGSPAEVLGIRKGDLITQIDGQSIDSSDTLVDYVAQQKPGHLAQLIIERDGVSMEFEFRLTDASIHQ